MKSPLVQIDRFQACRHADRVLHPPRGRMINVGRIAVALALTRALLGAEASAADVPWEAPEVSGEQWFNSEPVRMADLKNRVVLVEFWTFACSNCRNVEPYVKAWHKRYADKGFVVIGVHTPELAIERDVEYVRRYVKERGLSYPIVTDNAFQTWQRYDNHAWPAIYLIDKRGLVRYVKVGEGNYDRTEQAIQALLAENPTDTGPHR